MSSNLIFAQYEAFESDTKKPTELPYSQENYRFRTAYEAKYKHIDSTLNLDELHRLNFHFEDNFYFMPIHNAGSFTTPRTLNLSQSITPYLWFQSRLNHFTDLDKYPFYDTKSVFSKINYLSGNKYGQSLSILLTQSFNEYLSYGFEYHGLRNKGEYNKSVTDMDDINLFVRFDHDAYELLYLMSRDLQKNKENGGIVDFTQFEESLDFLTRNSIQTHFDNRDVFTEYQHQTQFIQQNLYLFRNKTDSLHIDDYVSIYGEFQYHRREHMYRDDTTRYYNSKAFVAKTNDSINLYTYALKIGPKLSLDHHTFKLHYIYQNTDYNTQKRHYKSSPKWLNNTQLQTRDYGIEVGYRFSHKQFNFNSSYSSITSGFSSGNHHLKLDMDYTWGEWSISATAYMVKQLPDLKQILYRSNYAKYNWNNTFDHIKHQTYSIHLAWQRYLTLGVKHREVSNFVYYDHTWVAQQYTPKFTVSSAELASQAVYTYGGWDQRLLYQSMDVNKTIHNLPELTYRGTFFYNDYFFDHALFGRAGIQLNYVSSFYGPRYIPLLAEFATQTEKNTGDYFTLNLFASAKVKTMKIYVKYNNLSAWINKRYDDVRIPYNYYTTYGYPAIDDEIQLGIIWYFFR